jgi:polyhydroxyalkanoate synthesis regulator protein
MFGAAAAAGKPAEPQAPAPSPAPSSDNQAELAELKAQLAALQNKLDKLSS